MKAKHTAGPWKALCDIQHNPSRVSWGIETAEGEEIADIMATGDPEETRLNAHLIAASPELLSEAETNVAILMALLIKLEGVISKVVTDDIRARIEATDAAIAKATGGAP